MMSEQFPALIIVFPLIIAFWINIVGWWWTRPCFYMSMLALSVSFISALGILNTVITTGTIHYRLGGWEPPWGIEYVVDHLNALILVIVSFVGLVVGVYSKKSIEKEISEAKIPQFYAIYTLLVMALLGMTVTGDAFNLYVLLEIASLAAYAFLMIGIAIKMAFFPLHVWLPDAYTHAPSSVSAFVAGTMTKVGAYVLIRVMFTIFRPYFSIELVPVTTVLGWTAVAAMIYGCVLAIAQRDLKRMLCYMLIAEVGYIVLGISVANRMGFTGAILHILNDAFMMACLFLVTGAIMYKIGTRDITNFRHLHKKMPFTMAAFTITALSVVGIPPTCGFFSKWYLILGSIDAKQWAFAVALVISSLLSAIVFFKAIEKAYFKHTASAQAHNGGTHEEVAMDEAPMSMLIPIYIMVAGILTLGLFSGKIISTVIQFAVPASF